MTGGRPPWRVGLYIRLSREDGRDESLSVTNQRKILRDFLARDFPDPYVLAGEYVDDGATGTDDERPGFQRLLAGIRRGAVDCVVCKTLSRAFRNYADQGYFLEEFFPRHRVRFIALGSPRVDTHLDPEGVCGYEVPISGVINDRYAGRTSQDVRRTLDAKRRRGEFIGAFAPYGYRKDPEDRNRLLPDPPAARVVADIFRWYADGGLSRQAIARRLNALGEPCPSAYKRRQGLRYFHPAAGAGDGLWSPRTVSRILADPVYAGCLVQGRQRVVSYKVHDRVSVPPEEWFVVPDAHPPLVPRPLFARARARAEAAPRPPSGEEEVHPLAGLFFCARCGRAMARKSVKGGRHVYYLCRTRREQGGCLPRSFRAEAVEGAVLAALRGQLARLPDPDALAAALRSAPGGEPAREARRREAGREAERLREVREGLYLDWKAGVLSREECLALRARLARRIQALEQTAPPAEERPLPPALSDFLDHRNVDRLDRTVLHGLVERVLAEEDGSLTIRFRFAEP